MKNSAIKLTLAKLALANHFDKTPEEVSLEHMVTETVWPEDKDISPVHGIYCPSRYDEYQFKVSFVENDQYISKLVTISVRDIE